MHIAYLGIGSSLGDRRSNCERSVELLNDSGKIKVISSSKWYITKAVIPQTSLKCRTLVEHYPDFINGVARIETELSPHELLKLIQDVEKKLGRVRTGKKWEPRTIDLDILFYDDLILDSSDLKLPHPEAHKRMFVLEPLCDIAPDLIHPVLKRTVKKLKEKL